VSTLPPARSKAKMTRINPSPPDAIKIERGILLNFFVTPFWQPHPLTDELYCYPGVEWWFQAYKVLFAHSLRSSERIALHDIIASSVTARVAKQRGRDVPDLAVVKWNRHSYNVMLRGCLAKFTQHEKAKIALVNTGDSKLLEWRNDPIWGAKNGGMNCMGKILEAVRGVL
jgi:ribA/ribD-fused uncharacterized protein